MEILFGIVVGGGCVALGLWAMARRRGKRARAAAEDPIAPEQAVAARGLEQIQPDDVVTSGHDDWVVLGVARLQETGATWWECRLDDAGRESWLIVDPRDPDGVILGAETADPGIGDHPSEAVEHGGRVFRLERLGRARVVGAGDVGPLHAAAECSYWTYRRVGDDRLWLRRGSGAIACFVGERVPRHLVSVLPGK